jgi:hypothetical protein
MLSRSAISLRQILVTRSTRVPDYPGTLAKAAAMPRQRTADTVCKRERALVLRAL